MKSLAVILLIAIATSSGWSQSTTKDIVITPVVSAISLDSVIFYSGANFLRNGQHRTVVVVIDSFHTTQGSAIVRYRGKDPTAAVAAASVAALQNVDGTSGILGGSYLLSIATGDTLWTLSDTASNTGAAGLVNSDTLSFWAPVKRFTKAAGYASGLHIQHASLPFGTVIDTISADSNGIAFKQVGNLKTAATAKAWDVALRAGIYSSAAYADSDAVGFPFVIWDSTESYNKPTWILNNIALIDQSRQAPSLELVIFNAKFTESADNAKFSPSDADMAAKCLRVIPINTWYGFPLNSVHSESSLGIVLGKGKLYGQLVSRGTPTFLSVDALKLRLGFLVE